MITEIQKELEYLYINAHIIDENELSNKLMSVMTKVDKLEKDYEKVSRQYQAVCPLVDLNEKFDDAPQMTGDWDTDHKLLHDWALSKLPLLPSVNRGTYDLIHTVIDTDEGKAYLQLQEIFPKGQYDDLK